METLKQGGHTLFSRDPEVERIVTEILRDIERNGMDAVRRYSQKFDDWSPASFELTDAQIRESISSLPEQVIADTDLCQANVRRFAEAQMKSLQSLELEVEPGITLGHRHIPINSVGAYIPGGRYPLFASAQMSIIPARVAGVSHVTACTPPIRSAAPQPAAPQPAAPDSQAPRVMTSPVAPQPAAPFPATINAVHKAGADRILVIGGIQAFAMMAFGLEGLEPADMLCGAGNKFVAEAKRQLFGRCGIDLLAGPTEILVIADDNADPALVACDLLGQAEHDPASSICLICLSRGFGQEVTAEVDRQLPALASREIAGASWSANGTVVVARDPAEAVALSDDWAPEHLEVHADDLDFYLSHLTSYGSLFLGEETTVAYGDKSIGTNHILPTGRAARYTGGLWVGKFLKTCTYQRMTPEASVRIGEVTERQCLVENMVAHAETARTRIRRYSSRDT